MEEFSSTPIRENIKKRQKYEEPIKRSLKKPEKNPDATNENMVILKDLMQVRTMDNEVVTLDL